MASSPPGSGGVGGGRYILDFYCPWERLGIELDGKDHFTDNGYEADEIRTAFLNSLNSKIIRFENKEAFNQLEGVLEEIRPSFTTPAPPEIGGVPG
jgi:very-short-patch-repair endonuclease